MALQNKKNKRYAQIAPIMLFFFLPLGAFCYNTAPAFASTASLDAIQQEATATSRFHRQDKKAWTFIVYIAADNDLRGFAARNIKQMAAIGSNKHINIVVHLDIRIAHNHKITRRYYIENNRILHVNPNDEKTERMDSGDPKTLRSCCKWAINHYPAENYALVLWNHGTGIIDPARGRIINPAQLFAFDARTNTFEVDRSIEFFDWVDNCRRGMCWDDTTGNYLTNQKLDQALAHICKKYLKGQKFSIIAFDACLMSMLEIANITKKHAHIMVGSQEVELGTGYNYTLALEPFSETALSPQSLARQIVKAYEQSYSNITNDYTHSAVNLAAIDTLEQNVHEVSLLLLDCLHKQKYNSVKNTLKKCRNKINCTHFDEPRYIDLHHLYTNVLKNIGSFSFTNEASGRATVEKLKAKLLQGLQHIKNAVILNTAGRNLSQAQGISVYFPEDAIHPSYLKTTFAGESAWIKLIQQYIKL